MNTIPNSPEALRKYLCDFLPSFISDWEDPEPLEDDDPETYHRVMREFSYSYGKVANSLSQAKLIELGNLINAIAEQNDDLENAFATCFLEHSHQINGLKALWPHLSLKARSECYA